MYISDFSLQDFRSYKEAVLHLDSGVTVFAGENGEGKTNIVEGVEYLSTFTSHRVNADASLVRQGAQAAVVRARVHNSSRSVLVEIEILAGKANRARINRANVRPKEILGLVSTVVFAPEDLGLVNADPAVRRKFLDLLMIQLWPKMRAIKEEYEKIVRQRAAVLKRIQKKQKLGKQIDESILDVWDKQLVDRGAQIICARNEIIKNLRPHVYRYYKEISGSENCARIDYQASINGARGWVLPDLLSLIKENDEEEKPLCSYIEENEQILADSNKVKSLFHSELIKKRRKDIDAGMNTIGPHRDDMRLGLGSLPAKGFASHGESWSYALALKLAQWQLLKNISWKEKEDEPILILDDVFSQLDKKRRDRLVTLIKSAQQVLVTVAVGDELPQSLHAVHYNVCQGKVTLQDGKER